MKLWKKILIIFLIILIVAYMIYFFTFRYAYGIGWDDCGYFYRGYINETQYDQFNFYLENCMNYFYENSDSSDYEKLYIGEFEANFSTFIKSFNRVYCLRLMYNDPSLKFYDFEGDGENGDI